MVIVLLEGALWKNHDNLYSLICVLITHWDCFLFKLNENMIVLAKRYLKFTNISSAVEKKVHEFVC